jgi:hypothetical protein
MSLTSSSVGGSPVGFGISGFVSRSVEISDSPPAAPDSDSDGAASAGAVSAGVVGVVSVVAVAVPAALGSGSSSPHPAAAVRDRAARAARAVDRRRIGAAW